MGGDFATGVSFFLPLSIFFASAASSIVQPYLSVNSLGREKEGVEAVNLGETTLLKDTIIER